MTIFWWNDCRNALRPNNCQQLPLFYLLVDGLEITSKIDIALYWGQDNSLIFSITILGPMIFSMISFQSFLPALARKTKEKNLKNLHGSPKYDAKHLDLFTKATNNFRIYKRLPTARRSLKIWSHLWAGVIVWYFSVGIKSLRTSKVYVGVKPLCKKWLKIILPCPHRQFPMGMSFHAMGTIVMYL